MKKRTVFLKFVLLMSGVTVVALSVTGCASSPPQAAFTHQLPKEHIIDRDDAVRVLVKASAGVPVVDYEKQRISQFITQKISAKAATSTISGEKRDYELDVLLTRYEKGNAFARAMLAGLGQIHIDAHVSLIVLPEKRKVSEFDVSKTFAWGGMYGGITSIEDVEPAFAEGIADAVTQTKTAQEHKGS